MEPDRWRQVGDLFEAALEREPAERRELLSAVGDADLRREVESLLAAHDAQGPIDRLAAALEGLRTEALASHVPALAPREDGAAGRLAPGHRLGRHEIRARLGIGGMGEVYRAYDTRLQREVAIKILGDRVLARSGGLQRLEREARAASALNHPNIVTVHDIGGDASLPYIVMELVEGESLRQLIRAPCSLELLLLVATQVADGLVAAHERAIVHRDLKPENVLVSREWVVKIVDFGLAQVRPLPGEPGADPGADPGAEPAGVQGTLGYVAPELLAGGPAGPSSDQFSFGAIVYELAAGAPAFPGATALETLTRSVRSEPPPLAQARPDFPAALVELVDRCLRKDPAARFGSTRELRDALRAVQRAAAAPSARATPARRPSALPAQRTRLVGRQRELEELQRLVASGARLVTLSGTGGTGKTRLALRVAELLQPEMPGGVIFVPLAAITDPALVVTAIAQAMGVAVSATRPALAGIIADVCGAAGPTLLVLDNFEQVLDAAPVVSELLAACPELRVLVTSREVLHLYGEHGYPVAPLGFPDAVPSASPEALAGWPAVALFVERAQAVKPDFRLTAHNARAVVELCAGVDGLPLALELAAAHTRVLPPEAMVARLDRRLGLLAGGARDLPARQRTLSRTIDWSHQLLAEPEKAVFRRLAVLAGGFTLEAAEAVADPFGKLGLAMEDAISALADKSLLQSREASGGEARFSMLETLRKYALERLAESGEEDRTRRAHAAYFLVLVEEGGAALGSSEEVRWLERFEVEHDNLRAALEWLTACGEAEWGLRLALGLFHFWERGEHMAEARRRLDALLDLESSRAMPALRARALFAAGVLASTQRDLERGKCLHRQCLELYGGLGDRRGVVVSLVALANQHVAAGEQDMARALLEQSLGVWEELGDRAGYARSVSNLAFVARGQGRLDEARALYQRAAALFDRLEDRPSRAWAMDHEGEVASEQDDLTAAESLCGGALDAFRAMGDRWGVGSALADLGTIARLRREHDRARHLYGESLASFLKLDHRRGIARVLEAFACLAADEAQAERGVRLAAAAAALRDRVGAPPPPAVEREIAATLKLLREGMGADAARAAWVEGAAMPVEEAIRLATAPRSS